MTQSTPAPEPTDVSNEFKKYPLSKDLVFGPTRQGEGPQAGLHCYFVRFAGCEYECGVTGGAFVCDTLYAVSPKHLGWVRHMYTAAQIAELLKAKGAVRNDWITLSGGNPALFVDEAFVTELAGVHRFRLAMETQGSKAMSPYTSHLIASLVISPKPPSSGMADRFNAQLVADMIRYRSSKNLTALKFVVFDQEDLEWVHRAWWDIKDAGHLETGDVGLFITPGTPMKNHGRVFDQNAILANSPEHREEFILGSERRGICESMLKVWEMATNDPKGRFKNFQIIPQLHALAYGQKAGV
jgi:7-carboxy-7-deazaguanine synthase